MKYLIFILLLISYANTHAKNTFLECSNYIDGQIFAQIKFTDGAATGIANTIYSEKSGVLRRFRFYPVDQVWQKSIAPKFLGYQTTSFRFNFEKILSNDST